MKTNIAIIIRALDHGGAERCASNMTFDLSEHYNVHLIVFDNREQMYPFSGTLHSINILPSNNKISKILNIFKRSSAVKKIKKENNIDCSISLLDGANIVNVMSSIGERTIVSIRNYVSARKLSKIDSFLLKYYCKKADKVVALSKIVGIDLVDNYSIEEKKVTAIYNSVDAERLLELSTASHVSQFNFPYIVTMGRLTKQKGHSFLIRAFSKVLHSHPNLHLVILGQGEDENALRNLAERLGISDSIVFPGYVKNPHNIISNSLLFVMSSVFEGLGNVILEAMACGKMVISTDCLAGPREILAPDSDIRTTYKGSKEAEFASHGILVPTFANDTPDFERLDLQVEENILADTIIHVIDNPQIVKHYEKKSLERIKDFTAQLINEQWVSTIEES